VQRILIALVTLALMSAACADDEPAGIGYGPSGSPTPEPSVTAEPSASASHGVEDGRYFVFVDSIDTDSDPATITFDLARFLTGDAAIEAAKEHGDEYPPPNDYYIVNDDPTLRTTSLSADVRLRIIDWANCCGTFIDGDVTTLAQAIVDGDPTGTYRPSSPFWITVEQGRIARIEEQYLP
jgi:hypothetical protein